jgi:hypothetical protein
MQPEALAPDLAVPVAAEAPVGLLALEVPAVPVLPVVRPAAVVL